MPTQSAGDGTKSKRLGIRVTPEEQRKIKRLAEARDRPYSALLREMGVEQAVEEFERTMEVLSEEGS